MVIGQGIFADPTSVNPFTAIPTERTLGADSRLHPLTMDASCVCGGGSDPCLHFIYYGWNTMTLDSHAERQLTVLQYLRKHGGWMSHATFASWNVGAHDLFADLLVAVRLGYVMREHQHYGLTEAGQQRLAELRQHQLEGRSLD